MADVTFRRGVEANLPTSGMATEGCVYQSTDTGNMYVGSSQGTLIPVNRSPYYGTCQTQAGTNAKVVTLDVDEDNFTMKAGVMISVLFSNANTASSPTLNVNNKGAVAVKVFGTTNVSASPRAWEAGEAVTFVHNGSYWMMVGHKTQSDWNQTDTAAEDFIKNKPTIPTINESLSANYGVCSSSASTVAKTVTVNNSDFALSDGVRVRVKFDNANHADAPTLAVNGTAAKPIVTNGTDGVGKGSSSSWNDGSVVELTYDGTSWVIDGWLNDNDVYHAGGSNVTVEDLDPFGEYEPLESIYNEASTVFSVDGVPSNQNDVFIDIRYKECSSLTHFYLFGQTGGSSPRLKYGLVQSAAQYTNKFHLCFRESSGAYLESTVERAENHIYRIKARLHNGTATLYVLDETTGVSNMVTTTYDITDTSSFGRIRLFAGGSSSYYCGSGTNVYFLKMDSEGKPFINYIPMRRKSDGMVGFLDTVSGSFLSSESGNVAAEKLNAGALIDRPDNHIIKVSTTVDDSNFVHKTGNETVGGEKTFTDNVKIGDTSTIVFDLGNDEGLYLQASEDNNGKAVTFGDIDDDAEVRLTNVAQPIDDLDAANKAYVDAAIEGGSSGITLPLAITDGGTGGSTAKGAEYRLTPNLYNETTADITDSARIPFIRSSPSATNGRFSGYKQAFRLWNYILDKITSLLGISYNTNDEGIPLAPTAVAGTNTTQIATTAFVQTATSRLAIDADVVHKTTWDERITGYKKFEGGFESIFIKKQDGTSSQFLKADGSVDSNTYITSADLPSPADANPLMDGTVAVGSSTDYAREDHVHPSDTSRVPTTRKVNNKPLSSDITLNASDVGALPASTVIPNDSNLVHKTGNENIGGTKTFNNNVVLGTSANLYFGTGQDKGVYIEAWDGGSGGQTLMFASLEDDSAVRLENIATPVYNTDAANKAYVDSKGDNNVVKLNGYSGAYGITPLSLCAFAVWQGGVTSTMESLTTSGGLNGKPPVTSASPTISFPIGCKIYYHPDATPFTSSTAFTSKSFYATYDDVDARYTAVTGSSISLDSQSTSSVYLRVMVDNGYWKPYYKSDSTTEIIVTSNNLVSGNFYIYLGKTVGSTGYKFQLEDNHPLYYFDGTNLNPYPYYTTKVVGLTNVIGAPNSKYTTSFYLHSAFKKGRYKVTLQRHIWWEISKSDHPTMGVTQAVSVCVKHNSTDYISGATYIVPVIESPNDNTKYLGSVVANLTGYVTFSSDQTSSDYFEVIVQVQGGGGFNLGYAHPLWGDNKGDVSDYNDFLILEEIKYYPFT